MEHPVDTNLRALDSALCWATSSAFWTTAADRAFSSSSTASLFSCSRHTWERRSSLSRSNYTTKHTMCQVTHRAVTITHNNWSLQTGLHSSLHSPGPEPSSPPPVCLWAPKSVPPVRHLKVCAFWAELKKVQIFIYNWSAHYVFI